MLSELYHLSKNVAKGQGIVDSKHPDCDEPGLSGYTNLKILIGDDGNIEHLDRLSLPDTKGENCLRLWTLTHIIRKKRNRIYFPAVRIGTPLILLEPNSAVWKALKRSPKKNLLRLLACRSKLKSLNLNSERNQAERICQWRHDESEVLATLQKFAASFLQLTADDAAFAELVRDCLRRTLENKGDDKLAKDFQTLVCGSVTESKGKPPKITCKVQMIFDYRPEGELSGALYTPRTQRSVIDCLKNEIEDNEKNVADASFICAFVGKTHEAGPPLKASFTKWPAKPVFGMPFYPFSKNTYTSSGAPCNARYRRGDADSFPIGRETANRLVEFASSMTTPGLHGVTWKGVKNGNFEDNGKKRKESQDVLIAYPSFKWDELKPVSIFARPTREEEASGDPDDEASHFSSGTIPTGFKRVAEIYIRSLKEKVSGEDRNKNYVYLLLLRAISSGQVQLVYSASPNCVEFDAALDCWIKSESYLPERLLIPLPSKKAENDLGWFRPRLLFPDEAIRVFTYQWIRAGNERMRIQAPPVGDIFNVFLRREGMWEQSASELLEALIPRVEALLIAAGQRIHLTDKSNLNEWNQFLSKDAQYCLSQALSLTGTLLHALNPHNSQHYMKETSYQLGRLLAAMDHLHKCYCDGERDGSYPPTLIGNGLLGRAADSPQEALAELCERGRIYLGWAETAQPKTVSESAESKSRIERQNIAVFSARKLLRIVSPLSADLHQSPDLDKPMDSMAKAHLFLGYLTKVLGEKTNQPTTEDQHD